MFEPHEPGQRGSSILPSAWSFRMFARSGPYPRDAWVLTWHFRVEPRVALGRLECAHAGGRTRAMLVSLRGISGLDTARCLVAPNVRIIVVEPARCLSL